MLQKKINKVISVSWYNFICTINPIQPGRFCVANLGYGKVTKFSGFCLHSFRELYLSLFKRRLLTFKLREYCHIDHRTSHWQNDR